MSKLQRIPPAGRSSQGVWLMGEYPGLALLRIGDEWRVVKAAIQADRDQLEYASLVLACADLKDQRFPTRRDALQAVDSAIELTTAQMLS